MFSDWPWIDGVTANAPVFTDIRGLQTQVPGFRDQIDGDGKGQTGAPGGLVQLHRHPVHQSGGGIRGYCDSHAPVYGCSGAGGAVIEVVGPDPPSQFLQIGKTVWMAGEGKGGEGEKGALGLRFGGAGEGAVQGELPAPVEEGEKLLQIQRGVKAGTHGDRGARQVRGAFQGPAVHIGAVLQGVDGIGVPQFPGRDKGTVSLFQPKELQFLGVDGLHVGKVISLNPITPAL